jgi:hypothetical protein
MDSFHEERGYCIVLVLVVVLEFLFRTAEDEFEDEDDGLLPGRAV